jgi:thiaminase (transcriptional activator TenA)
MTFSQYLRSIARPIWAAQLTHPFVIGLGNGTLPERKFKYYILQDALFLNDLAEVFAIAAEKAPDAVSETRFAKLAEETLIVERSLHETYSKRWKLTHRQMSRVPMAPTNHAYTRHMLQVAQNGSALDATVVTLPCAWIYCVVGQHLLRKGKPTKSHPYRDWLLLYSSPEFAEVAAWMRGRVDAWAKKASATEKVRLEQAFLISSRYEWMFWEMAWNEESWPV